MRTLIAEEIAQMLRVPKGRVYELVRQGKLPAVRIGRQLRFREETVATWLAEMESGIAPLRQEMSELTIASHRRTA